MRALVTGANGFLGRHVVAALLARGHSVRVLVRPAAPLDDLGWPASVEVFRADLRARPATSSPPSRAWTCSCTWRRRSPAARIAQFAATVVGTERLLGAMARTACRRLVLASSFSVYDWSAIDGTLDETSPRRAGRPTSTSATATRSPSPGRSASPAASPSKHGWDLTVLRPGFIWGRDHAYLAALGQQVGRLHLVIGPLSRIPMTHVENCADLFALAASDPRARGQTFNVVDGEGERIWSYLGEYLRGTGERGFRIPIPYRLAYSLVQLAFATVFKRNLKLPHVLVPCRFESRLKPLHYTNRLAREVLGWRPPFDFAECLSRTFGPAPLP